MSVALRGRTFLFVRARGQGRPRLLRLWARERDDGGGPRRAPASPASPAPPPGKGAEAFSLPLRGPGGGPQPGRGGQGGGGGAGPAGGRAPGEMAGPHAGPAHGPERLGLARAWVVRLLAWLAGQAPGRSTWESGSLGSLALRLLLAAIGSGERRGPTRHRAGAWGLRVNQGSNRARFREDPDVAHVAALPVRGKGSVFAVWYGHDHPKNFEGRLDTVWREHAELAAVCWALLHHPCDRKLAVYTESKSMVRYLAEYLGAAPANLPQLGKMFGGADDAHPFLVTAEHARNLGMLRGGTTLVAHTKKGLHPRVRSIVRKLEVVEVEGAQRARVPGVGEGVPYSEQIRRVVELVECVGPNRDPWDTVVRETPGRARKRPEPKGPSLEVTRVLALDCEMVGVGRDGYRSILARVSVVNSDGNMVYDSFVAPTREVTDYRTWVSGVRPKDLARAPPMEKVQAEVKALIAGHVVVGHALKNDWEVLGFAHRNDLVRDTATYGPLCKHSGKPKRLKKLAAEFLGLQIQTGEHSPQEDAMAALYLYQKFQARWDIALGQRALHKRASKKERREQALKDFLGGEEGEDSSLPVGSGEEVGDNIYSCLAEA